MKILILLSFIQLSIQLWLPEQEFSQEFTPLKDTNETLVQKFRCGRNSRLKELNFYKYFPTKISCNDWNYKKISTYFNIKIDDRTEYLDLPDMDTLTTHLNGHLIIIQKGLIADGICAGGMFDKLVFNKVDDNACSGEGVKLQETIYGSIRIDGGNCQAVCFGDVTVKFSPGITNT